jgi:DNA-binding response OmpR family regulator
MTCILIAEDESRIAAFVEKGLRKNGFSTAIAVDGEQAVKLARSGDFDLLLLDLGLPVKDGWTVLTELREHRHEIPVIIVTARDDIRDRMAGIESGADEYVTKPFRFTDLLARIRYYLPE